MERSWRSQDWAFLHSPSWTVLPDCKSSFTHTHYNLTSLAIHISPSPMHPNEAQQENDAVNIPEARLVLLVGEFPSHPPCLTPIPHM